MSEGVLRASQQQVMHCAEEQIGHWLPRFRLGGDSQQFRIVRDAERESFIQRRDVTLSLGKTFEASRQVISRRLR